MVMVIAMTLKMITMIHLHFKRIKNEYKSVI